MANQSLAVVPPQDTAIYQEKAAWELMREQAALLIKTGFLPQEINTPEKAIAVMMKGRELGIPHMYALSNIAIVKGKPSCSAELMLALIRRDHGPQAMRVKETTNESCTVEWRQQGWTGTQTYTFTIQDAQKAGLTKNTTWQSYPAAMLRARCISAVARMQFPESIAGMYSPGELGEAVTVTDDGEVISGSVELGEIIDAEVTSPTKPATRNIAARGTESQEPNPTESSPGGGTKPSPEPSPNLRRLHAIAKERGLTHDELHAIAASRGAASLKELSNWQLAKFESWLERANPDTLRKALAVAVVDLTSDEPPADEAAQGRLSDDEIAAMAAATDSGTAGDDKWSR